MDNKPKNTDSNGRDKNGRFISGNSGKPKGAVNKSTKDLRNFLTSFLNEKREELFLIWDNLNEKEKATLYLHLSKLVMPKAIEETEFNSSDPVRPKIVFTKSTSELTKEQIDEIIEKL